MKDERSKKQEVGNGTRDIRLETRDMKKDFSFQISHTQIILILSILIILTLNTYFYATNAR